MAQNVMLQAQPRSATGTLVTRRARAAGRLPAVIYGHQEGNEVVTLDQHEVEVALSHGAHILDVEVSGRTQCCLIKEVQYDHLDTTPIHLDLTRVDVDERVKVTVGIELRGTPAGVTHGGVLDLQMSAIEIECLVSAIPETLRPIVAHLEVGDSLFVKDLELPAGATPVPDGEDRIATIHALAIAAEDETDEEAGEGTPEEPERIGRVRKDEDAKE